MHPPGKPGIIKSGTVTLLLLLVLTFHFSPLYAQAGIPDSLVRKRIAEIEGMLVRAKPAATCWWNGWLYGYSAATLGQGVVVLSSNNLKTRQDMALGAITTLIGAAGQLLMPMQIAHAPEKLALIPGDTPQERTLKLQKTEALFEACAMREKAGRSWKMHAASGAVNLGSGLVTWLGFGRSFSAGLWNFALNTAITEAQIWTQPVRAMKQYKKYNEKYKEGIPTTCRNPDLKISVNPCLGGLTLRFTF